MAAMRATLESAASGGEEWTERNPALRRALLRTDKFLARGAGSLNRATSQRENAQPMSNTRSMACRAELDKR